MKCYAVLYLYLLLRSFVSIIKKNPENGKPDKVPTTYSNKMTALTIKMIKLNDESSWTCLTPETEIKNKVTISSVQIWNDKFAAWFRIRALLCNETRNGKLETQNERVWKKKNFEGRFASNELAISGWMHPLHIWICITDFLSFDSY